MFVRPAAHLSNFTGLSVHWLLAYEVMRIVVKIDSRCSELGAFQLDLLRSFK